MGYCTAVGCYNHSGRKLKKRVHNFPADPERQLIWKERVPQKKWNANSKNFLCEDHFDESQYENRRADKLRKLRPFAVPTIFKIPDPPPSLPKDDASDHTQYENRRADIEGKLRLFAMPTIFKIKIPDQPPSLPKDDAPDHTRYNSSLLLTLLLHDHSYYKRKVESGIMEEMPMESNGCDLESDIEVKDEELEPDFMSEAICRNGELQYSYCKANDNDKMMKEVPMKGNGCDLKNVVEVKSEELQPDSTGEEIHLVENGLLQHDSMGKMVYFVNDGQPDSQGEAMVPSVHVVNKPSKGAMMLEKIESLKQKLNMVRKEKCALMKSKGIQEAAFVDLFNEDQLQKLCNKATRGIKWSDETIKKSLQLLSACGRSGYKLLLIQKQPLPSLRTLRKRQEKNYAESILMQSRNHDNSSGHGTQEDAPMEDDDRDNDDNDENQHFMDQDLPLRERLWKMELRALKLKNALAKERRETRTLEKGIDIQKAAIAELFTEDQLERLRCSSKRDEKWAVDTIRRGLRLLSYCGEAGYELLLSQNQPLPSIISLKQVKVIRRTLKKT